MNKTPSPATTPTHAEFRNDDETLIWPTTAPDSLGRQQFVVYWIAEQGHVTGQVFRTSLRDFIDRERCRGALPGGARLLACPGCLGIPGPSSVWASGCPVCPPSPATDAA